MTVPTKHSKRVFHFLAKLAYSKYLRVIVILYKVFREGKAACLVRPPVHPSLVTGWSGLGVAGRGRGGAGVVRGGAGAGPALALATATMKAIPIKFLLFFVFFFCFLFFFSSFLYQK